MVVVGLGNPGAQYARTRHNLGARAVEFAASRWGIVLKRRNPAALLGQGTVGGEEVALARPRSFMNASGESVAYLVSRFGIPLDRLLVVYDDIDLPLGMIRLRPRGGPGSHNGMRSIIETLQSEDVPRFRIGIGAHESDTDRIEFVLGNLSAAEEAVLEDVWPRVTAALACLLTEGLERAMTRFNTADDEGAPDPRNANGA